MKDKLWNLGISGIVLPLVIRGLCFMDIFLKEASFLDSILCSWGTFRHYRCWTEIDPLLMNTREWVLERNLEISNIACYLD